MYKQSYTYFKIFCSAVTTYVTSVAVVILKQTEHMGW